MESFHDYKTRILSYLEGRDPIELQTTMPDRLEALISTIPSKIIPVRPAPNKWSIKEIVAHLADDELVGTYRIKMILSDPGTIIQAFDQDKWADIGRYNSINIEISLRLFRQLRESNLFLFKTLTAEQWQYFGIHAERGKESIEDIAAYYAGHDVNHFEQIKGVVGKKVNNMNSLITG